MQYFSPNTKRIPHLIISLTIYFHFPWLVSFIVLFILKLISILKYQFLCLMTYKVHTISFQTFFVWAFNIVIDSSKFTMLLLYILWDDWPIFMISASNEQLQQQLEYTQLSQLVNLKNAIGTWGHFRRMICNKIVLNLEKMPQKPMECFRLL